MKFYFRVKICEVNESVLEAFWHTDSCEGETLEQAEFKLVLENLAVGYDTHTIIPIFGTGLPHKLG